MFTKGGKSLEEENEEIFGEEGVVVVHKVVVGLWEIFSPSSSTFPLTVGACCLNQKMG